jgi:membrane associated rhomboid family serine protease
VRRRRVDVLVAGLAGAVLSGIPSTLWTLVERGDPAEGGRALGRVLLPREERTVVLLAAGAPVHLALSLGWAGVLGAVLPQRAEPLTGAVGGLAIAALDLVVLGRLFPPIRALPQGRQWADHVAFGLTVGVVLQATRPADRRPARAAPVR